MSAIGRRRPSEPAWIVIGESMPLTLLSKGRLLRVDWETQMDFSLAGIALTGALLVASSAESPHTHPGQEKMVFEADPNKALSCDVLRQDLHAGSAAFQPPEKEFSNAPRKAHDPNDHVFSFDQLSHFYRTPGEYTHRLNGDEYGFNTMSFIITETHPGGGPGFHVHDTEEAHVLLEGTAQYRIGSETFTVTGPYVAKVPAGTPHTFVNAGTKPFNLVAVFASKRPGTTRLGVNPLVEARSKSCGPPSKK